MKYEMIFGDYKFANRTCEIAMQSDHGEVIEMTLTAPVVVPEGWRMIAMRRIIKEPKQWTWEDKKAGRLPEVGWLVYSENDSKSAVVIAKDHEGDIWFQCSCGIVRCTDGYAMLPIETPAEKSQREEDEFVESTCRQNEPHSTLYSDGVRAAYRKLKGGE